MAIGKGLFDFIKQPSVLGGSDFYRNIAKDRGMNERYSHYFQHHESLPLSIFFDSMKEVYLYHFQVAAGDENNDTIYDIVIEFTSRDPLVKKEESIRNYDFRIYSNSPGFTFTYAYVFNKHRLLIPMLKDKYDERFLTEAPKKLNPNKALGYDYTLYIAMRYLQLNSYLLNKSEIKIKGKPLLKFKVNEIASAIETFDSRTGVDKNAFAKLAVETKRATHKVSRSVTRTVSTIGSKFKKMITPVSVTKPQKGTAKLVKKAKTTKVVKPRRKR